MATDKSEKAAEKAVKKAAKGEVLPPAGTTSGGVTPNSAEAMRGPIVSKASTLAEAHETEKAKP